MARTSGPSLKARKNSGEKIAVLTAYDYPSAKMMDECGVDVVLVGDSVGMVVMGLPNTLHVTMDDMLHYVRIVSRAVEKAMVVADMPFLSYQISVEEAVRNAGRFIAEAGAQAVKLEGGAFEFGDVIRGIHRAGIPVMGHIGLMPQSVLQLGGYKIQGRDSDSKERLLAEAKGLEEAGCFAIVLECIPSDLAGAITRSISIPTIGIGAGPECDGQVLVMHDMLGLGKYTKFAKVYVDLAAAMRTAFSLYVHEVKKGVFPSGENTFK